MARPVLCDPHAGAHSADVMLTDFSDGTTVGLCRESFLAVCLAVIEQAAEAEATETAAEAERKLSNAGPSRRGRSSRKSGDAGERPESQPSSVHEAADDGFGPDPLGAGSDQLPVEPETATA